MINMEFIPFDIDILKEKVRNYFNNSHLLSLIELKNLKEYFDIILIEYPYKDIEFSSVYSLYYSKKFKNINRNTLRLHFFNEKENLYGGYLVISDSPMESIGRGVFDIEILAPKNFYVLNIKQKINLLGEELKIFTFPWMMQDTDVDVCAHVAIWSLNSYFSYKLPYYRYYTVGEIASLTPTYLGRTIPSEGLNVFQMSDLLISMNYYPLVLFKDELKEYFFHALYSYLESGFPILIGMNSKEHAITLMGHGPIDNDLLKCKKDKKIVYNSELITSYLAVDDNYIPFTVIGENGKYKLDDINYFLVPLPEKVYLNAIHVYKEVEKIINRLEIKEQVIVRIYLTTTRNFKQYIKVQDIDKNLKGIILKMEIPRFIWIADIYNNKRELRTKIVFDATAGEYENEKWISILTKQKLYIRDSENEISEFNIKYVTYKEFKGNLKEIK